MRGIEIFLLGSVFALLLMSLLSSIETGDWGNKKVISQTDFDLLQEAKEDYFVYGKQCDLDTISNCKEGYLRFSASGFWINDVYNTCHYTDNKGNVLFEGYCYQECKEESCSYEETLSNRNQSNNGEKT